MILSRYSKADIGLIVTLLVWVLASLGPGWYVTEAWNPFALFHEHYLIFKGICHQNPERSFSILGWPMAVCSRCFGIYWGLAIGAVIIPLFSFTRTKSKKIALRALLFCCGLTLLDVLLNLFLWDNTLLSRFALGFCLGLAAINIISPLKRGEDKPKN